MALNDTITQNAGYGSPKIARWVKAAIAHVEVDAISDPAGYFATVPACRGAWAQGPTPEDAIRGLEEALADWAAVHLRTGNEPPLPAMGDISLG
ncbi:MAG: type II toxin-antitoxin system HicB family antitoxin [bacterium]|nr:type II toxin-antitoxin system HicB family antitoxin [bacterium]